LPCSPVRVTCDHPHCVIDNPFIARPRIRALPGNCFIVRWQAKGWSNSGWRARLSPDAGRLL
jgi:hypothetical protein